MSTDDNEENEDNEDKALWAYLTHDVEPLKKDKTLSGSPSTKPPKPQKILPEIKTRTPPHTPIRPSEFEKQTQLDKRTDERLRKGQMPIEARLDLHGLTQTQALDKLTYFIQTAHISNKRCVLIITGKGQKNRDPLAPAEGILKQKLPEWLNDPSLKPMILKTHPAKPKDGGSGAYYVLLRRTRTRDEF